MRTRVLFFGTPEFSLPTLVALHQHDAYEIAAVVTQPDRPRGRGQQAAASPVKLFAVANGLPVLQPESVKRELNTFLAALDELGPVDCGVVIAFGQILPQRVLDYPKIGCLNIHASLLPRWRGAAPMQHAILSGDRETGVCIMKMEAGLDTGPVFSREAFVLTDQDTLASVHDHMSECGARLLLRTLPAILNGSLEPVPQPEEGVTYASKIENKHARIDWNLPANELERLIRALCPVPGAFATLDGKRIKIFAARSFAVNSTERTVPGDILYCDNSRLEVQCGTDALLLEEVQLEGKRRMPIADFLRGNTIQPGMKFN